jgi:predicted DNA binding CopG/RHH family protein
MTATKIPIPKFKSEKEEAAWWDAHPEVITALFLRAKKEGKIKRLPVVRGATRSVTIRMPIADIETAQEIAEKRGLPYQTYVKGLLHRALERDRKAG